EPPLLDPLEPPLLPLPPEPLLLPPVASPPPAEGEHAATDRAIPKQATVRMDGMGRRDGVASIAGRFEGSRLKRIRVASLERAQKTAAFREPTTPGEGGSGSWIDRKVGFCPITGRPSTAPPSRRRPD